MADPQIGQGFNNDIAYRYQPGQTQAEYYSQKTGQTFGTPEQLSSYVNANYQGVNTNAQNVFGTLAAGYTPASQALGQVKNDLNSYQNNLYNTPDQTPQRQSSSLTDSVGSAQSDYQNALNEYNDLKTKLENLQSPNYEQAYTDLINQQGIPGLNTQIGNIDAQRNDLPYTNRAASGNAGIETEGQLSADTSQKDIPLAVQQQNLINRLQLAQSFVDNSMKFKQMDSDQAHQSLTDAINTVAQAINISKDHLDTLNALDQQNKQQQQAAQQFAYNNQISQPFYEIGGTIYRTSDQKAYSDPKQFYADGGSPTYANVQHLDPAKAAASAAQSKLITDLITAYPDAGIAPTDSLLVAESKLSHSRIYEAKVRPPQGSGSKLTDAEAQTLGFNGYDAIFTQGSKEDGLLGIGSDGFANPATYNAIRTDAISKGFSADSFDKEFSKYVNPADPQDYNGVGTSIKQPAPSKPGLLSRIKNWIF